MTELRPIEPGDEPALLRFFARLPDRERTFVKEDVDDPGAVAARARPGPARVIAVDDGEVVGSVAVVPLHGWSGTSVRCASSIPSAARRHRT